MNEKVRYYLILREEIPVCLCNRIRDEHRSMDFPYLVDNTGDKLKIKFTPVNMLFGILLSYPAGAPDLDLPEYRKLIRKLLLELMDYFHYQDLEEFITWAAVKLLDQYGADACKVAMQTHKIIEKEKFEFY